MSEPAYTGRMNAPAQARGRVAIIPVALIGGLALAAAGGFYVWREIATPPVLQNQNAAIAPPAAPPPASAPLAKIAPSPPRHPSSAKLRLALDSDVPPAKAAKTEPAIAPSPADAQPIPIRIEHRHESDAVDPILLAAWQAYRNGDYDAALQRYSEVLRKDADGNKPPGRDALLGMAAIAQQRSQDTVAAGYFNQVLALDPRDPDAHAGMSSLPGASGATGAESRLKILLAQRPEAAALHFALGNHYAEQSRWGDAQQAYFSACALESDSAQFAFNLAVSLDHLGQSKLAAQHYRHALQLDSPDSGKTNSANASFDHARALARLDELAH